MSEPDDDVIDRIAGLSPDGPVAALRRRREEILRFSQGSHDVLLADDPAGLSGAERRAAAALVATIHNDMALASHYGGSQPVIETPRLSAILAHVNLVSRTPKAATAANLEALQAAGLSARDIVVLSQLIAFVSYQARVVAGLRLLQQEAGV